MCLLALCAQGQNVTVTGSLVDIFGVSTSPQVTFTPLQGSSVLGSGVILAAPRNVKPIAGAFTVTNMQNGTYRMTAAGVSSYLDIYVPTGSNTFTISELVTNKVVFLERGYISSLVRKGSNITITTNNAGQWNEYITIASSGGGGGTGSPFDGIYVTSLTNAGLTPDRLTYSDSDNVMASATIGSGLLFLNGVLSATASPITNYVSSSTINGTALSGDIFTVFANANRPTNGVSVSTVGQTTTVTIAHDTNVYATFSQLTNQGQLGTNAFVSQVGNASNIASRVSGSFSQRWFDNSGNAQAYADSTGRFFLAGGLTSSGQTTLSGDTTLSGTTTVTGATDFQNGVDFSSVAGGFAGGLFVAADGSLNTGHFGTIPTNGFAGFLPAWSTNDPATYSAGGIGTVKTNNINVATGVTSLNFSSGATAVNAGGGQVNVTISGGGSGTGTTNEVWVNVRDYGATGNGVTDDTAAIQAAIDASVTTNAPKSVILYGSTGTYLISASITNAIHSQISIPQIASGEGITNWVVVKFKGDCDPQRAVGTQLGTGPFPSSGTVFKIVNTNISTKGGSTFATFPGTGVGGFNAVTPIFENITFVVDKNNNGTVLNFTNAVCFKAKALSAHPPLVQDISSYCDTNSVFLASPNHLAGNMADLEDIDCIHFATGFSLGEHVTFKNLYAYNCITGITNGAGMVLRQSGFPVIGTGFEMSGCNYGIYGSESTCVNIVGYKVERAGTNMQADFIDTGTSTAGTIFYDAVDNNDSSKSHRLKILSSFGGGGAMQFYNTWTHAWENFSASTIAPYDALGSRGPVFVYSANNARVGGITLAKAEGTTSTPSAVTSGQPAGGSLSFAGFDGTTYNTCGLIYPRASATASSGNTPASLDFYAGTNSSTLNLGLRIQPTGDVTVPFSLSVTNGLNLSKTITAGGTTGAQTINKSSGSVNFAAAASTMTVTDSLVTANSIIICTVGTVDTTAKSAVAVAGSGSFTITLNAAATAETRVNFLVTN